MIRPQPSGAVFPHASGGVFYISINPVYEAAAQSILWYHSMVFASSLSASNDHDMLHMSKERRCIVRMYSVALFSRVSGFTSYSSFFISCFFVRLRNLGSGSRYALVIGNGSYVDLGKLKNPTNDAADMAAALRNLKLRRGTTLDADLVSMENGVNRLGAKARGFFRNPWLLLLRRTRCPIQWDQLSHSE